MSAMNRCPTCGTRLGPLRLTCAEHPEVGKYVAADAVVAPTEVPSIPGYHVDKAIGAGGFSIVYAAKRETDGKKVALKVGRMTQGPQVQKLLLEGQSMRDVGAAFVPEIYQDSRLEDGSPVLAMELLSSVNVASLVEMNGGRLPRDLLIPTMLSIVSAVEAVHAKGYVHCDLKPENIFFDKGPPPSAKLIDFGLVQRRVKQDSQASDDMAAGTAEYMSPEQIDNHHHPIDAPSDVYSLGVILYELCTGRPPFLGSESDIKTAHRSLRPDRPSTYFPVAEPLEQVILKCLAKHPRERYVDAGELHRALSSAVAQLPVEQALEAPVAIDKSKAPVAIARAKVPVGLAFFVRAVDLVAINKMVGSLGGNVASTVGNKIVAVFTHEAGDNPAKRAFTAATWLQTTGACARVMVDLAPVGVRKRPDGTKVFTSPLFTQSGRFIPETTAPGIFVSPAVASVLRGTIAAAEPGLTDILRVSQNERQSWTGTGVHSTQIQKNNNANKLVGRNAELDVLLEAAKEAIDQRRPGIGTVYAEAGHGKSVLGTSLLQQLPLEIPNIEILTVRASEPVGGDTQKTLFDLLSAIIGIQPGSPIPTDGGKAILALKLGTNVPAEVMVAASLALGFVSFDSPEVQAVTAAPGALRIATARAIAEGLQRHAELRPIAVVLDDAQWADDTTLDGLEIATFEGVTLPLWICALARPVFEKSRAQWGQRTAKHQVVRLGALTQEAARDLCRELLLPVVDLPIDVLDRLIERTQAIPLFLVELIRGLHQQGIVRKEARGKWYLATEELDKLPNLPLVQWLASRELDALPPELSANAQLLALLGDSFDPNDLPGVVDELDRAGLGHLFRMDPKYAMQRLLSAGLLLKHRTGRLGFRHALVREAVVGSVTSELTTQIHQAVYRYFEKSAGQSDGERLHRIAYHAALGGLRHEASQAWLELAERARNRHIYLESERAYTEALSQLEEAEEEQRVVALQGRALMRYRLQRSDDSIKDFESARALAAKRQDVGAQVDILLDEATALDWAEDFRRSKDLVDEATRLGSDLPDPVIQARITMGNGRSKWRFVNDVEAGVLFTKAAEMSVALGNRAYETYVISLLVGGYISASLGKLDESEAMFASVISLCTERGDKLHLAAAIGNRILLWIGRNDREHATKDMEFLRTVGREMGSAWYEQQSYQFHAWYLHWAGDFEAAEKEARMAEAVEFRRFGDASRSECTMLLTRIFVAQGKIADAERLLEIVRKRQNAAQAAGRRELELMPAESVFFHAADLATRGGTEEDWDALQKRAEGCLGPQELIEFFETRGLAAQHLKREKSALDSFHKALEIARRVPNLMLKRLEGKIAQMERPEAQMQM